MGLRAIKSVKFDQQLLEVLPMLVNLNEGRQCPPPPPPLSQGGKTSFQMTSHAQNHESDVAMRSAHKPLAKAMLS